MTIKELRKWAQDMIPRDIYHLMSIGVPEKKLTKIKPHCRAVFDNCSIILQETAHIEHCTKEVERNIKLLKEWGLPIPVLDWQIPVPKKPEIEPVIPQPAAPVSIPPPDVGKAQTTSVGRSEMPDGKKR